MRGTDLRIERTAAVQIMVDPLTLLSAPKLFEYMKYANGAVDIDFGE